MVSFIPKSKTFTKFTMDSWTKMATPSDARLVVCLLLIRSLKPGIIISSNLPSLVSVRNTIWCFCINCSKSIFFNLAFKPQIFKRTMSRLLATELYFGVLIDDLLLARCKGGLLDITVLWRWWLPWQMSYFLVMELLGSLSLGSAGVGVVLSLIDVSWKTLIK